MALVSGGRSTLNPNAPLFVPAAFRQVEDFSPEWWQLVTTSTWYHDYWLSLHQDEEGFYNNHADEHDNIADLLPETFDIDAEEYFSDMEAQFEEFIRSSETQVEYKPNLSAYRGNDKSGMEVNSGSTTKDLHLANYLDGKGPKILVEPAKYMEKPTKSVPKYSPRRIQQPR